MTGTNPEILLSEDQLQRSNSNITDLKILKMTQSAVSLHMALALIDIGLKVMRLETVTPVNRTGSLALSCLSDFI